MPGCLTSTTVNITPFVDTSRGLHFFSLLCLPGFVCEKHEIRGGADLRPHYVSSNVDLTVFVVINAYLCSASAVIFLAPISAFDQVCWSLRMVRSANALLATVLGRRSTHKSYSRLSTALYFHVLE